MSTATSLKHVEPFVVAGGLKGRLSGALAPRRPAVPAAGQGHRHPHPRLRRRAQGALLQGRARLLRVEQPPQRPPRRDPHPRGQDHRRGIRGLDPPALEGKRQGKVLVEMGALSPKDLWEGVQFQIREIVYSLFQWEDGHVPFRGLGLPEKERITVDLERGGPHPRGHPPRRVLRKDPGPYPAPDVVLERWRAREGRRSSRTSTTCAS